MGDAPDRRASTEGVVPQDGEKRWTNVLEEVAEERKTGRQWWQNVGIFLAWAAGFAVAAALVATIVLGLVELFKAGRQFTATALSDYVFWASAILMVIGFVSPTSGDLERVTGKRDRREARPPEGRSTQLLRQRVRRMYDPWRWRLWAGALLAFGISILTGLVVVF